VEAVSELGFARGVLRVTGPRSDIARSPSTGGVARHPASNHAPIGA
jgi:hypothetical protein